MIFFSYPLTLFTIVGKVENGCGLFATGGQTNGFLEFKLDLIFLPMFWNCGSVSIRSCGH